MQVSIFILLGYQFFVPVWSRIRTRVFSGGIPILCWGIGAGAKEEEDKENLITFPILLSADLRHQLTTQRAQVFKTDMDLNMLKKYIYGSKIKQPK